MPDSAKGAIDVSEAVAIAQQAFDTSELPAGVAENDEAYVIGYNTALSTATMSSRWAYIYKKTGEYRMVGSGVMSQVQPTLRPVNYR